MKTLTSLRTWYQRPKKAWAFFPKTTPTIDAARNTLARLFGPRSPDALDFLPCGHLIGLWSQAKLFAVKGEDFGDGNSEAPVAQAAGDVDAEDISLMIDQGSSGLGHGK